MESKYKEILLLTGLDNITDEELDRFKFFLPDELKVSTAKLENANRTEVANLMIQNVGAVSAVTKTIHVFQKLNYMHVAKSLQEEKEKGNVGVCSPSWSLSPSSLGLSFHDVSGIRPLVHVVGMFLLT